VPVQGEVEKIPKVTCVSGLENDIEWSSFDKRKIAFVDS
jgi:hypothetical protein